MAFVVSPPQLALCTITRVLTSNQTGLSLDSTAKRVAQLVQFCVQRRYEATSLRLPSLSKLLTQLQEALGEPGTLIGDYCRDQLSRLSTVTALTEFIESLRGDLEGRNGVSPLLQSLTGSRQIKIALYSPLGLFLRECIAAFDDLKFEQVSALVSEISEYCPSMLDQAEAASQYLADQQVLQRHYGTLAERVHLGMVPSDRRLDAMATLETGLTTEASYLLHEVSTMKTDVSNSMETFHKYYGHVSSKEVGREASHQQLFDMCLRMASLQNSFNHAKVSRSAAEDAFKMVKEKGDEKAVLSCLALLIQILLQSHETAEDEISLTDLNRYIERCFQKSKQLKLPDLLGFAALARALMALKNGIIRGEPANTAEVHRLVLETERNLRRLRDSVAAATVVLTVNHRPLSDDSGFDAHKLFLHALTIMEPGTKRVDPALMRTMDRLVTTMEFYVAQSWKRMGRHSLSLLAWLSIEAAFHQHCSVTDRVEALGHIIGLQADRKGYVAAQRILEAVETYPSCSRIAIHSCVCLRMGHLKDGAALITAERRIQLEGHLSASAFSRSVSASRQQHDAAACFDAWNSHRLPSSTEKSLDHGYLLVEALIALERGDDAENQIEELISLCRASGTPQHEAALQLLYSHQDIHQDNPDLLTTFLDQAGSLLEDAEWTTVTIEAVILYCKALMKWNHKAIATVEALLTTLLPFALSEGSLRLQTDVVRLLIALRLQQTVDKRPDKRTQSLFEKGVRLAGQLGVKQLKDDICRIAYTMFPSDEDIHHRSALIRRVKRPPREDGAEDAGMTDFSDDAMMDID